MPITYILVVVYNANRKGKIMATETLSANEALSNAKIKRDGLREELSKLENVIQYLVEFIAINQAAESVNVQESLSVIISDSIEISNVSLPEAALNILRENGKPMHLKDIANEIRKRGNAKGTTATIYSNLFPDLSKRKSDIFIKTAPATFGLVEWEESDTVATQITEEEFGPTKAIKQMFDNNPQINFIPIVLRDKLLKLKEEGKLKSESKDLLSTTHSVLKHLVKINYIEKDESKEIPTYRRKINE